MGQLHRQGVDVRRSAVPRAQTLMNDEGSVEGLGGGSVFQELTREPGARRKGAMWTRRHAMTLLRLFLLNQMYTNIVPASPPDRVLRAA